MTVSSLTSKSGPYTGNGAQTVFAYGFKVFAASELQVVKTSTAGVETVLTLTTHYSVSGVGSDLGGNVTLVAAPAAGELVTIVRSLALTQEVDLRNQGGFYPEVHERAFDRLTMQAQQIDERLSRGLRVPVSDATPPVLPAAAARANKVLVFDAAGQPGVSDAAALASVTASAYVNVQKITSTGALTYNLVSVPGSTNAVEVSVGGVMQTPIDDYSLAGNTLTFVAAPTAGLVILCRWFVATQLIDQPPFYFAGGAAGSLVGVGSNPANGSYPADTNFAHWVAGNSNWGWRFNISTGMLSPGGNAAFGRTANRVNASAWTVTDRDTWLLNQWNGGALTLTLPSPASNWRGREIMITNQVAQTVVSAASDVMPIDGSTAGTAILPATAGAWCTIVATPTGGFGSNVFWRVMQRGT